MKKIIAIFVFLCVLVLNTFAQIYEPLLGSPYNGVDGEHRVNPPNFLISNWNTVTVTVKEGIVVRVNYEIRSSSGRRLDFYQASNIISSFLRQLRSAGFNISNDENWNSYHYFIFGMIRATNGTEVYAIGFSISHSDSQSSGEDFLIILHGSE